MFFFCRVFLARPATERFFHWVFIRVGICEVEAKVLGCDDLDGIEQEPRDTFD